MVNYVPNILQPPYAPQGHPLPRPCCRIPTIASRAKRLDPSPGAQGQQPASQLRLPGPASTHQSQSQSPKGGRWNARRGSASGRLGGQRPAGARGQHDRQRVGCEWLLAAGRGIFLESIIYRLRNTLNGNRPSWSFDPGPAPTPQRRLSYGSMPWIGPTPDDLSVSGFSP